MTDWGMDKEDIEKSLEKYGDNEPYSGFCRECPEENICMVTINREDRLLVCSLFQHRVASEAGFDEKIKGLMTGDKKVVDIDEED